MPPLASQRDPSRQRLIDILRGAAALAVALFHFSAPYPRLADPYHQLVGWGWLGVPLFFVVSGYCVATAREKDSRLVFWFKRLGRIFPPYWGSLVVVGALIAARLAWTGVNDLTPVPKDAAGLAYTLLAITAPASSVPGMNWAYWSLGYELAFYLLLGLLPRQNLAWWLGLVTATSLVLPAFPFDHWGQFCLGVCGRLWIAQRGPGAVVVALAAVCVNFVHLSTTEAVAGLATLALVLFPPAISLHRAFDPLAYLGKISYSLYLIHVPIGCYLIPHLWPTFWPRTLALSLGQDTLSLAACVGAAAAFYCLIEKPSHELARRGPGAWVQRGRRP